MKKYLILLACTAFLGQAVLAEEFIGNQTLKDKTFKEVSVLGNAHLTNVTAESLSILGNFDFHNIKVAKEANIAGPVTDSKTGKFGSLNIVGGLEATDITCKKLDVAGLVNVTGLTVTEEANVVGSLTLKASKDPKVSHNKLKKLTILADEISLEDTDVEGNILVKKHATWFGGAKKQVLRLLGKTMVKGNITFESGTGTIEQGPEVKVEGKVTGASSGQ